MDIYFVRHAVPNYDNDSLTEKGHFQAEKTAEELSKIPFDMIFSSSMGRAKDTAKHLANKLNLDITTFDWAREDRTWTFMGDHDEEGNNRWFFDLEKNKELLAKLVGNKEWYNSFKPSFKQLLDEDRAEMDKWLLSLNILHKDGEYKIIGETPKNIAFFAHGAFGLVFYSLILDLDYPSVITKIGMQEFCGVAHFRITDEGVELISHSKTYY